MRILGQSTFEDALAEWGLHEGLGFIRTKHSNRVGPDVFSALEGADPRSHAIDLIRWWRKPVIQAIEQASPLDFYKIEIEPSDLHSIRVMGGRPLLDHASDLGERQDDAGEWVRRLASSSPQVRGPFLAVSRDLHGQLTLLDGLHRATAWVIQMRHGDEYSLICNLVLTEQPVPLWEK